MTLLAEALPDEELGRLFMQGDHRAFGLVFDRYHRLVYAVGRRGTGSHHEAEEVVQQTFLRAWQGSARFDPARPLGPWLATIARRIVIDRHRRQAPCRPVELDEAMLPAAPDPTDELGRTWELRRALEQLPPAHREVLRLTHYQALDQAQIAERLGVAVGTVKSRVHRASLALRAILEQAAPAAGPSPATVGDGRLP